MVSNPAKIAQTDIEGEMKSIGKQLVAVHHAIWVLKGTLKAGGIVLPHHIDVLTEIDSLVGQVYQELVNEDWTTIKELNSEKGS
jgi:hypothetical protein